MSPLVMTPRPSTALAPPQAQKPREATPQQIIATARSAPAPARGALAMSCLTAALMWAAFTPVDFGPLGWVCLIPLLTLVRIEQPTRWMYRVAWLGGLAFWLPALQWMRLGDPIMYPLWIALSLYLACYFPAFVALSRVAVHRFSVPLMLAVPVIWTGLELLRGTLMTGFGWYALGYTQYRWIELIQICDVVGVYGVSFLLAMTAACAVELLPGSLLTRLKLLPASDATTIGTNTTKSRTVPVRSAIGSAICLVLFAGTLIYGYWRRGQADFQPGPLVALIQGNVTSAVKHDPRDWPRIEKQHERLTGRALLQSSPDLIVWPETMFRWPLVQFPPGVTDEELQQAHPRFDIANLKIGDKGGRKRLTDLSQMTGAALLIGVEAVDADRDSLRTYNSAAFIRPDTGLVGRYDKIHRVVFGEYIPFVEQFPWLRKLSPFPESFGLTAGAAAAAFEFKGYRFAPIICFEDTIPHLVRRVVNTTLRAGDAGNERVDVLVNLTNDGWFHGSSELDQHLITAAFRSVECRTPMVRAVNTGISAVIDGDGVIRQRAVDSANKSKQVEAVLVATVPLDRRPSLYLAGGDWFAGACLAACAFFALMGVMPGRWVREVGR